MATIPDSPDEPPKTAATRARRLGTGRWDFRVQRLFLAVGTAAMLLLGLVWMITEDAAFGASSIASLIVLAVVGGWGLARWLGGRDHPGGQVGWFPTLLLLWVVIGPLARWVLGNAAPTAIELGSFERLMLVPAAIALVMIVSGRLALHLFVSRLAAFVLVGALFATDDIGDFPRERVSAATTAQLTRAAATDQTVLVRGTDHDEGAGVRRVRPAGADDCRELRFTDQRRTLLGLPGRRLEVRFDACWSGDGEPTSLTVINHQDKGAERGEVRAVRLLPVDAFTMGTGGLTANRSGTDHDDVEPALVPYGDDEADLARRGTIGGGGAVEVRDEQGRITSDGDPTNDTVLAQVGERGNEIEVVVAFESADLFMRSGKEHLDGDGRWSPDRIAGMEPRRGYARDIVHARIYRRGGSYAVLMRRTDRGGLEIG